MPEPVPGGLEWYRESRVIGAPVNGLYFESTASQPAIVFLHIPDVFGGLPRFLWGTSAGTLLIARTLTHEIGHHVLTLAGTVADNESDEETEASRYEVRVLIMMERELPIRFWLWLLKKLGDRQLAKGIRHWEKRDYRRALLHFDRALNLWTNRPLKDWYERARAECLRTTV